MAMLDRLDILLQKDLYVKIENCPFVIEKKEQKISKILGKLNYINCGLLNYIKTECNVGTLNFFANVKKCLLCVSKFLFLNVQNLTRHAYVLMIHQR